MKNIEKYINIFCELIVQNLTIGSIPYWLYKKIHRMNKAELAEFFLSDYDDIEPKKLGKAQKLELKYMIDQRKIKNIQFVDGYWLADDIKLVEDYSMLNKEQTYKIQSLLSSDEGLIPYVEYLSFKKHRIELGIQATDDLNFEISLDGISNINQILNRTVFGARDDAKINRFTHIIHSDGTIMIDIGTKRNSFKYDLNKFVGHKVKLKLENKVYSISIDDVNEIVGICDFTKFKADKTLIIGGLKTGDTIGSWSEFKLLGLKLWDKQINLEFKPAYNVSGELALFEQINEQYYLLIDENVPPTVIEQ